MHNVMEDIYIALGSNIGDREQYLQAAIAALGSLGEVAQVSSFFDTEPVGYTDQDRFLNAALLLRTDIAPQQLIQKTLQIEADLGRVRDPENRNGPRTIDIDILFYGNQVINEPNLEVPHPRMHERTFVLEPLVEIAPDLQHPVLQKNIVELLFLAQKT